MLSDPYILEPAVDDGTRPPGSAAASDNYDGTGAAGAGAASSMPLFAPFVFGASLASAGGCTGSDGAGTIGWSIFISTISLLAFSLPSLFLFGVTPLVFLGGVLASTFSCAFWDELWVGRIILSRKFPSGAFELAVLSRDFGLSFAFSAGFDPAGKDDRIGFGRRDVGFEGTRSLGLAVTAGAASVLAADAAVGAVAEAGSRTGRVGDFGRGFVNDDGGMGSGFFPGFGAGFETAVVTFGATDRGLGTSTTVFLASFGTSFFKSFEAADFGESFLENGCLLSVVCFLGVRGAGNVDV